MLHLHSGGQDLGTDSPVVTGVFSLSGKYPIHRDPIDIVVFDGYANVKDDKGEVDFRVLTQNDQI